MTPEEQVRDLRSEERWESAAPAPRPIHDRPRTARPELRRAAPVIITAIVAVIVVIASIGLIRLVNAHGRSAPAATVSPTVVGATAIIRGTAPTTTRTIDGVGTAGGPTASEVTRLQALAERTGRMVGEPDRSTSDDVRLHSAVVSVLAAFTPAVHDLGGTGPRISVFFLVLNRAPTDEELQLLRLLPFTVRVSWGPRLSVKERDREQQAAFRSVKDVYEASGDTEAETDTLTLRFWPDRDHPRSAADIARQMAATISRITGRPPTYSIQVTDLSKTADGRAALHATGRTVSDDGARLLVGDRPTGTSEETGVIDPDGRFVLDPQRCVAVGDEVVIAPPGSSISADGLTVTAKGVGTYAVAPGTAADAGTAKGELGGTMIDARTAATYLPRGSTLCGATRFLLLAR